MLTFLPCSSSPPKKKIKKDTEGKKPGGIKRELLVAKKEK